MTCIAVYRIPGEGAALACDSRLTGGEDEVITDNCKKWLVCGPVLVGFSGRDGGLIQALEPARSWADVVKLADEYTKGRESLDWDILAYDRRSDRVLKLDSDGCQVSLANVAATGSGGVYALGYIDASQRPATLDEAAKLLARAVRAAGNRHTACGGKAHVLLARGRRKAIEFL